MIGQQLGPYTIEAELGSGGMGTVYRATGPEGVVALKVVHPHLLDSPGFFKRFLREAEVGKRPGCPARTSTPPLPRSKNTTTALNTARR